MPRSAGWCSRPVPGLSQQGARGWQMLSWQAVPAVGQVRFGQLSQRNESPAGIGGSGESAVAQGESAPGAVTPLLSGLPTDPPVTGSDPDRPHDDHRPDQRPDQPPDHQPDRGTEKDPEKSPDQGDCKA